MSFEIVQQNMTEYSQFSYFFTLEIKIKIKLGESFAQKKKKIPKQVNIQTNKQQCRNEGTCF